MEGTQSLPIRWMEKAEFWSSVSEDVPTDQQDDGITFTMPLSEITPKIPIPPVDTPTDEGDFPGPVSRWYGRLFGCPFIFTYHHHSSDWVEVAFRSDRGLKLAMEQAFLDFRESS